MHLGQHISFAFNLTKISWATATHAFTFVKDVAAVDFFLKLFESQVHVDGITFNVIRSHFSINRFNGFVFKGTYSDIPLLLAVTEHDIFQAFSSHFGADFENLLITYHFVEL